MKPSVLWINQSSHETVILFDSCRRIPRLVVHIKRLVGLLKSIINGINDPLSLLKCRSKKILNHSIFMRKLSLIKVLRTSEMIQNPLGLPSHQSTIHLFFMTMLFTTYALNTLAA